MALFDLPLDQLRNYKPERPEAADFDAFWARTLEETREEPLDPVFEWADFGLVTVETYDVAFCGYGGQRIKGWLMAPAGGSGQLPCVIEYVGYGGGRGFPYDWLPFSAAGYAHLVMDTRGQGSVWRPGDTPDLAPDGDNAQTPGFMTRGILEPETYYYRRLISDAVRAVETARSHPRVDPDKIIVSGGSQAGGLALAVAGLVPGVIACMPDVPFMCHFRRAIEVTDAAPYQELVKYLAIHRDHHEKVYRTLSYFDGMNFAARALCRALFSVGMMDVTCPPSTVFAAYNHYAGPKDIVVYPYNNHEGGEQFQTKRKIEFLRTL